MDITGGMKKLKADLKNMTWKQRWEHLWTYYRWVIIVAVMAAMIISMIVSCIINLNTNTLIAGTCINVELNEDGNAALTEQFKAQYGTGVKYEEALLTQVYLDDFETTKNYQDNYYTLMSLLSLCSAQELDYIIADQVGMENMLKQEAYLDLSTFFTADELAALGDKVIMARSSEEEEDESKPVAVDITELPFVQEFANLSENEKVYFAVIQNTTRLEQVHLIWEVLNSEVATDVTK
jgi:hypothetical protein